MDDDDDSPIQDGIDRFIIDQAQLFEFFITQFNTFTYFQCVIYAQLTTNKKLFVIIQSIIIARFFSGLLNAKNLWRGGKFSEANRHTGIITELEININLQENKKKKENKKWKPRNFKDTMSKYWEEQKARALQDMYLILQRYLTDEQLVGICKEFQNGDEQKDVYGCSKFNLLLALMCTMDAFLQFCKDHPGIVKRIIDGDVIAITLDAESQVVSTINAQQRKYEI
jgi:hypothetical protein